MIKRLCLNTVLLTSVFESKGPKNFALLMVILNQL